MAKPLFLVILLTTLNLLLKAQINTVFEDASEKTITIQFNAANAENINNQIIQLLQKSNGGELKNTQLEYNIKEHQRIVLKNGKYLINVAIGNLVLQGEHIYKNFPVNQMLIPSIVNFQYSWISKQGQPIQQGMLKDTPFKSGEDVLKLSVADQGQGAESTVALSDISFYFSEKDLEEFKIYIQAVDAYYDADAKLNLMGQDLDKITTDSIELLDAHLLTTENNILYFDQLKGERLTSKLRLDSYDPIRLKTHLGITEERNRTLKKELEYTLKNMHETYYKKGMDWLSWKKPEMAASFFNQSIQVKNTYAPPYYQLALLDFKQNKHKAVLDTCAMIINQLKPDTDTRYNTIKLAEKALTTYLDTAQILIDNKKFNLALDKITYCENYRKRVEGVRYFEEIDQLKSAISQAYYQSMADQAQKQITNNALANAGVTIDSMINFRLNSNQTVIKDEAEHQLLNNLYTEWGKTGAAYLQKEQPDSALYALSQANIICNKYDFVDCTTEQENLLKQAYTQNYRFMLNLAQEALNDDMADSALTLIALAKETQTTYNLPINPKSDSLFIGAKQLKYNGLIAEGSAALNSGDGQQALAFYEEATVIQNEVRIKPDSLLNSLSQEAGATYILTICSQCETYIEALQIDKARLGFDKARWVENQYALSQWPEIKQAIDKLNALLSQGNCSQQQHEFNIKMGTARRFIEQKDFINTEKTLHDAWFIVKRSAECNINTTELAQLEKDSRQITEYQKKLNRIEDDITTDNFQSAIQNYISLNRYYNDSVKNNFGIEHKEPFDFIKAHKNTKLLDYAARFYTEQSEPELALDLLNELYRRQYIASWSEKSQSELGKYLANQDFNNSKTNENTAFDPKEKVNEYTNYLSWFKFLKKAYLDQWKVLSYN